MSDDLIAFLKAWHEWATNGAPEGKPFIRATGLCSNASFFSDEAHAALTQRICEEFAGSMVETPFGLYNYHLRFADETQHECPKRLAWVRERLIEAGELVA